MGLQIHYYLQFARITSKAAVCKQNSKCQKSFSAILILLSANLFWLRLETKFLRLSSYLFAVCNFTIFRRIQLHPFPHCHQRTLGLKEAGKIPSATIPHAVSFYKDLS